MCSLDSLRSFGQALVPHLRWQSWLCSRISIVEKGWPVTDESNVVPGHGHVRPGLEAESVRVSAQEPPS